LGKEVEVPEQDCPGCERRLAFWGWYQRWARRLVEAGSLELVRIWVRRGYCRPCDRHHALLPDFLHEWRRDAVEVIGGLLTEVVEQGRKRVYAAVAVGLPLSTARNLCQRHQEHAPVLFAGFSRLAVERGAELARQPGEVEAAAVHAAREGWEQACRRWGEAAVGGRWRWWSRLSGGRPLGRRAPTFPGSAGGHKGPEHGRKRTEEDAHGLRPGRTNRPRPLPGHR
jgi:hypothetical protein